MKCDCTHRVVAAWPESNLGCACKRTGFGADDSGNRKAAWFGAIGLGLSAALMIAMGFHKAPTSYRRRRS